MYNVETLKHLFFCVFFNMNDRAAKFFKIFLFLICKAGFRNIKQIKAFTRAHGLAEISNAAA